MGQGTVDLPDPLDAQESSAVGSAGVDDLIAQMAGDEIDRLLAESEKGETSDPVAAIEPSPIPQAAAAVVEPTGPTEAELEAKSAAENADLEMKATLDALAEDLKPLASKPAEEQPAPTPVVIPPDAVEKVLADAAAKDEANRVVVAAAAVSKAAETATSSAERAALAEPKIEPATAAKVEANANVEADDAPTPIWLKPLVLLSAPLGTASAGVRDAIGKIAILTTFNAAAVLIYVMIFRRH